MRNKITAVLPLMTTPKSTLTVEDINWVKDGNIITLSIKYHQHSREKIYEIAITYLSSRREQIQEAIDLVKNGIATEFKVFELDNMFALLWSGHKFIIAVMGAQSSLRLSSKLNTKVLQFLEMCERLH